MWRPETAAFYEHCLFWELEEGNAVSYGSLVEKGTVFIVKKAERKRVALLANLGDINRPVRVRPVRVLGREWWAIDADDTWAGMVMDLRRLGFDAMAWEDLVLVREDSSPYEPQMEGPANLQGLKPFPTIQQRIIIRKETYPSGYSDYVYLDENDEDDEDYEDEEDELEPEDLSGE